MELVEGGQTLAQAIGARGPIAAGQAADLIEVIGEALIEAAQVGVVHRDLAPKNVLFAGQDIKLVNFSLPVPTDTSNMWAAKVAGVPEFVAPEQVDGKPVDQRSNLYNLGALYYYVLTGQTVASGTPDEVYRAHTAGQIKPPSQLVSSIPTGVEAVIMRALDKSPTKRFLTVRQFVDEVDRVGSGESIKSTMPLGKVNKPRGKDQQTLLGVNFTAPVPGSGADRSRRRSRRRRSAPRSAPWRRGWPRRGDACTRGGGDACSAGWPVAASPATGRAGDADHERTDDRRRPCARAGGRGVRGSVRGSAPRLAAATAPVAVASNASGSPASTMVGMASAPESSASASTSTVAERCSTVGVGATGSDDPGGSSCCTGHRPHPHPHLHPVAAAPAVAPAPQSSQRPQRVLPAALSVLPCGRRPAHHDSRIVATAGALRSRRQVWPFRPSRSLPSQSSPFRVVAGAPSGKKKGAEDAASKGKFRETLWFKKGELDAAAAQVAAQEAAKGKEVADKADTMPIDERYKDGTISHPTRRSTAWCTGATQMMSAVRNDAQSAARQRSGV